MIDRDLPVPPYRQLADVLRTEITEGRLNGRLPGERRLAQEYDVAINTVRKAIAILREEGRIESVHGLGSFAVPGRPPPAS
jgi:DNA-binding GntR family transcriptional regulator